jgi:hypothetical protein
MRDTVLPFLVMVTVSPQIHYIDMPQGRATQRALGGCPSHSLSTKSPDRIPKACAMVIKTITEKFLCPFSISER